MTIEFVIAASKYCKKFQIKERKEFKEIICPDGKSDVLGDELLLSSAWINIWSPLFLMDVMDGISSSETMPDVISYQAYIKAKRNKTSYLAELEKILEEEVLL